jgi:hypothetical protein
VNPLDLVNLLTKPLFIGLAGPVLQHTQTLTCEDTQFIPTGSWYILSLNHCCKSLVCVWGGSGVWLWSNHGQRFLFWWFFVCWLLS